MTFKKKHKYPKSFCEITLVITVITQIRKLKTEQQLSLKTTLKILSIFSPNKAMLEILTKHIRLLKGVIQAESIICKQGKNVSILEQVNDQWQAKIEVK